MEKMLKRFTLILAICAVFICMSTINVCAAVVYKGKGVPFENTVTGQYGKLIWKQDFEDTSSIGNYYYDPDYISPYALNGASLSDPNCVWTGDGDETNPGFSIVSDPSATGNGKVLQMDGKSNYPIYKMNFGNDIISKPGKYTFAVKLYNGGNGVAGRCRFLVNRCYSGAHDAEVAFGKENFADNTFSYTVCTREEFDASGLALSDYSSDMVFAFQYAYLFMMSGNGKTCWLDDIEMWYEEYADITFHIDSADKTLENSAAKSLPVVHKSLKPGQALPTLNITGTGYDFIGWSTVKGDESAIINNAKAGKYDLYAIYRSQGETALSDYAENLNVKDAITIISRMHAKITGNTSILPDSADFDACLAYALSNNLLPETVKNADYRPVTRFECAMMLANALPDHMIASINTIDRVPGVNEYQSFSDAVFKLYRAGIIGGINNSGEFGAYQLMDKSSFEKITDRIINTENRVKRNLTAINNTENMICERETTKNFDASFISAPESYLKTLEQFPDSQLPLGDWMFASMYTRAHLRKTFTVSKNISKAVLEFQGDFAFDIFVNGTEIKTPDKSGSYYLSGLMDVTDLIKNGENILAIRAYLSDDPMKFTAGIRGCLRIEYTDGNFSDITTSDGWNNYLLGAFWTTIEADGWQTNTSIGTKSPVTVSKVHPRLRTRSCYFRKSFDNDGEIQSAYLYTGAKGLYVPYINGVRVTEGRFLPGSMDGITEYQKFDVKDFITSGENILSAELGNGWYNRSEERR